MKIISRWYDIREKFSEINISFQDVPFGDRMRIQLNTSKQGLIVDTTQIGNIDYNSEEYNELLNLLVHDLILIDINDHNYKPKIEI